MKTKLEEKVWWDYIHDDLKGLLRESVLLVERVGKWDEKFNDYAFVVFPAAKAYEGFLKTLFLDLGFITEKKFYGKRFRIGRALNPSFNRHRKKSVYDKMVEFCSGKELPDALWDTWKHCRNLLFHWFPNEKNTITYQESKEKVDKVINSIDLAFKGCKIDR